MKSVLSGDHLQEIVRKRSFARGRLQEIVRKSRSTVGNAKVAATEEADDIYSGKLKSASAEEVVMLFAADNRVTTDLARAVKDLW